ncbi:hypothetical protein B9Z55_017217 [Caenorhabditis nigoni]|uniref:G-protein coupled receptors family 1 profile domain-containing protein n=1 Tax=Caenorhabditis nigoni TaxID=1611254 RepID=A0A2G5T828_9PELO|nr:hypothetical protein B9Z55_017217 [Caenorhabditis nigoni]
MGNYKYLLIIFAVFDVLYSISEILTPIGVTGNKHGFVVFLTEGPFFEHPEIGQHVMSNRCGFISLSYALLIIHFVYRYMALFHPEKLHIFFRPIGILTAILFLLAHAASWSLICQQCLAGNEEIREILADEFLKDFGADSKKLPMLTALYYDATDYIRIRSWIGIFLLTITSFYSMSVYFVLGFKIMRKISVMQSSNKLSKNSIRLQKQLFQTLIIQTCIPIVASFLPTVISWYAPIFFINMEWWNTNVATVALAAFPFIDPLAVIYLIPSYRNALLRRKGLAIDDSSGTKNRRISKISSYVSANIHSNVSNA